MIEVRDLEHLLSLDEHRHFGRAAAAVGLTQPALTKSLKRLEAELGTKLFDRSRARVAPTPIGQEVISRARGIVGGVAELTRAVDLMRGLNIGQLALGVGPAMSESYVTDALARVANDNPQARISVRVDHWRQLTEWLLAGEIDLYVADITEASEDERLDCTPLPAEELVWFCRAGHPPPAPTSVARGDILSYPIATPRMPRWARSWFAEAFGDETPARPTDSLATVECEYYPMLKRIVLTSDSISAALPSTIRSELDDGDLVALPLDAPSLTTLAGIVQLRDRTPSPLAETVSAAIRAEAQQLLAP